MAKIVFSLVGTTSIWTSVCLSTHVFVTKNVCFSIPPCAFLHPPWAFLPPPCVCLRSPMLLGYWDTGTLGHQDTVLSLVLYSSIGYCFSCSSTIISSASSYYSCFSLNMLLLLYSLLPLWDSCSMQFCIKLSYKVWLS